MEVIRNSVFGSIEIFTFSMGGFPLPSATSATLPASDIRAIVGALFDSFATWGDAVFFVKKYMRRRCHIFTSWKKLMINESCQRWKLLEPAINYVFCCGDSSFSAGWKPQRKPWAWPQGIAEVHSPPDVLGFCNSCKTYSYMQLKSPLYRRGWLIRISERHWCQSQVEVAPARRSEVSTCLGATCPSRAKGAINTTKHQNTSNHNTTSESAPIQIFIIW